jgi:hypothetical protein
LHKGCIQLDHTLTHLRSERRLDMRAHIGDTLHIHNNHTGLSDQTGRIVEIRGEDGTPPFLIEFSDGRIALIFPGPDAVVEEAVPVGAGQRSSRRVHNRMGW